jgi:hypothetical protein
MAKVATAFLIVVGLWISAEVYEQGPERAFGGIFQSFSSSSDESTVTKPKLSTAQRAGGSVSRSRDEATARRERLLGE